MERCFYGAESQVPGFRFPTAVSLSVLIFGHVIRVGRTDTVGIVNSQRE